MAPSASESRRLISLLTTSVQMAMHAEEPGQILARSREYGSLCDQIHSAMTRVSTSSFDESDHEASSPRSASGLDQDDASGNQYHPKRIRKMYWWDIYEGRPDLQEVCTEARRTCYHARSCYALIDAVLAEEGISGLRDDASDIDEYIWHRAGHVADTILKYQSEIVAAHEHMKRAAYLPPDSPIDISVQARLTCTAIVPSVARVVVRRAAESRSKREAARIESLCDLAIAMRASISNRRGCVGRTKSRRHPSTKQRLGAKRA